MNCTACPYQNQIEALRAKCLACDPNSSGGTPHGKVRADEFTLNSVPKAMDYTLSPSERVTHLSADDEHKLRMAMTDLFSLDPVELLLVQHLLHGGALSTFGAIVDRVGKVQINSRQAALYYKRKLLEDFKAVRCVIANTGDGEVERRMMGSVDE